MHPVAMFLITHFGIVYLTILLGSYCNLLFLVCVLVSQREFKKNLVKLLFNCFLCNIYVCMEKVLCWNKVQSKIFEILFSSCFNSKHHFRKCVFFSSVEYFHKSIFSNALAHDRFKFFFRNQLMFFVNWNFHFSHFRFSFFLYYFLSLNRN